MNLKFRLYKFGHVKIEIVGYQKWNLKQSKWQYSIDNQNWNQEYIQHQFKDICLNTCDANDVQLYQNDIVSCLQSDEDGNESESYYVIVYDEQGCTFLLVSPNEERAEPIYYTGADILYKEGCMHIDYKIFKEFGVGSKKIK